MQPINAALHWKTDGQELLACHKDYLCKLVFQWLLKQCKGHCIKSSSTDDVQDKENIGLNFSKEHLKKPDKYWQNIFWLDKTKINLSGSDKVQFGMDPATTA